MKYFIATQSISYKRIFLTLRNCVKPSGYTIGSVVSESIIGGIGTTFHVEDDISHRKLNPSGGY